jgi:hypothetical protein
MFEGIFEPAERRPDEPAGTSPKPTPPAVNEPEPKKPQPPASRE